MFRKIVHAPLFWPVLWVVVTGLVSMVVLRYRSLDATQLIVIATGLWMFVGLSGLYMRLDQSIATAHAASAVARHPELQKTLLHAASTYDAITEPLIRDVVRNQIAKFNDHEFSPRCTLRLTHQEFGYWLAPYVEREVRQIQAFSKSWVTNWTKFGAASDRYRNAQRGKNVRRIFVLRNAAEYADFATRVFPAHEQIYGAGNILVISKERAASVIKELPSGIADDEDFAIFDDRVLAFCKGDDVRVRTDKLETCRNVFGEVSRYAVSLESLKTDATAAGALFETAASTS